MHDTTQAYSQELTERLADLFTRVYPTEDAAWFVQAVAERIEHHEDAIGSHRLHGSSDMDRFRFDQRDLLLIAYPDMVVSPQWTPLATLQQFLRRYLPSTFSYIHMLPFYPYSSDDGFSVVDYLQVDPKLGTWDEVATLAKDSRLMFDAVVNHVSSQSAWFSGYLNGDEPYRDFFIEKVPGADYTKVVRPRVTPLFTSFQTTRGEREVWTTFSSDQIDLNYHNPRLLLAIIDILLDYVAKGAAAIRLDAVNYLWKEPGTSCSNLGSCHAVIQMIRTVFDLVCPWVVIVTETNIPHSDNVTYFGDGYHEAQVIYQFALPPLVVHSFLSGEMHTLSTWAGKLEFGTDTSYLNFLASHDGVGIIPATGILAQSELDNLVSLAHDRGGDVSYKSSPQGGHIPYELNCTFYDLICDPKDSEKLNIRKFITSQSILLALRGIPALYYHSLFGSRNFTQGVAMTGMKRTINRKKFTFDEIEQLVDSSDSRAAVIFQRIKHLIEVRKNHPAFSPHASQTMLDVHPALLSLYRILDEEEKILVVANASDRTITANLATTLKSKQTFIQIAGEGVLLQDASQVTITVPGYGFAWWVVEESNA